MWVSLSRYNFGTSVAFLQSEEEHMRYWKFLALPTLIAASLSIPSSAPAQVSINIGAEPVCPYGYYDAAPYNCAPYGYYGPEWFSGGVFIGAGPWFHGPRDFNGHVDNLFDRTDFRCVSRSVRGVWAEGGSLSHTSDRRALWEAGILYRYRPLGRISVRRLRPNTLDPSPVCSRRIGCCVEPL